MRASATALKPAVPLLLAALLGAPLVWRLVSVPPPDPIVEPLTEDASEPTPNPIALPFTARVAGADVFKLQLTTSNPSALAAAAEVHLAMANYASPARLLEAWLSIDGTPCRFRTRLGARLADNALLIFHRQASCDVREGSPTGTLELEVRLDMETGRVAVWTDPPPATGRIQVVEQGEPFALRGQTLTPPPPATRSRIGLLAYVWDVTPAVLWARLRTIAVLVLVGLALLLRSPTTAPRGVTIAGAVFGTTLLMTGLALAHALLFPPLQAPDEPIHTFSLAEQNDDKAFRNQIVALGNRTHFERLRHHTNQRFRERDIDQPWNEPWSLDVNATPIRLRSPVTAWWWKRVAGVRTERAVEQLWTVRRANSILFGVVCGIAVGILTVGLPSAHPAALSLTVLAVPTLPFFASYLSDMAVLVSVSLVLAACVAVLVTGTSRVHWLGIPLSFGIVVGWLAGRSAWPVVGAVLCVLVGHAHTGGRPARPGIRRILSFWIPVTIALGTGAWLAQRARLFDYLEIGLRTDLPEAVAPFRALLEGAPWLAVPVGVTLASVEWLTSRTRLRESASRYFSGVVVTGLAAWLLTGFVLSSFITFPVSSPESGGETYATNVLASMAVPFRLAHHDLLLSTLFWSGMGWVDIVAPPWVLDVAIGATVMVIVWSLAQARADGARALRYLTLFGGLTLSLVVYAAGAAGLRYAVYGRYLVGWYLLIVVTAWAAPAFSSRPWWPWLVVLTALHAFYLQSIPARYF